MKKYTYIFGMIIAAFAATACSVEYAIVPTVRVESRLKVRARRVRHHIPAPPPPVPSYHIPGVPGHGTVNNTTIIIANNTKPAPAPAPKVTTKVVTKETPKAAPKATHKAAPAVQTPAPATRPNNQTKAEVSGTRQARPTSPATGSTASTAKNTANRGR